MQQIKSLNQLQEELHRQQLQLAGIVLQEVLKAKKPRKDDLEQVLSGHFMKLFEEKINYVADRRYYQRFTLKGWTNRLALETTNELLPQISQVVALAWLAGIEESKK